MRGKLLKTLVIIPCYNEEKNIEFVVERLKRTAPYVDYIIVNDCSTDKTADFYESLQSFYESLHDFDHSLLPLNSGNGVRSHKFYIRHFLLLVHL